MPLLSLEHVNLRTARLEAMCAFYTNVLGLEPGPRPPFAFGGAWLYCGGKPVVHLVEVSEPATAAGPLSLEHFAFAGSSLSEFLQRLQANGVEYRLTRLPGSGQHQVFVHDPDRNRLHVDFDASESA
ncbi:MAG TPA: VOC family protein [Polyangiaceae bacterium]|jgi:catechol 2,3-dioxygenase-like lactoylglutathione lyase family enzyme|nr:VOC family protein [Polyangiaceae bacterium]